MDKKTCEAILLGRYGNEGKLYIDACNELRKHLRFIRKHHSDITSSEWNIINMIMNREKAIAIPLYNKMLEAHYKVGSTLNAVSIIVDKLFKSGAKYVYLKDVRAMFF